MKEMARGATWEIQGVQWEMEMHKSIVSQKAERRCATETREHNNYSYNNNNIKPSYKNTYTLGGSKVKVRIVDGLELLGYDKQQERKGHLEEGHDVGVVEVKHRQNSLVEEGDTDRNDT